MGSRLDNRSASVRKKIENHTFDNEEGEEYEGSKFGGFTDYFRRKKIKLQNLDVELRARSGDKPQIFRGVVAHINGYTQPSLNDLHAMLVSHGAGFIQYLDGKTMVTHIIASSLTPKKAVEFKRYRIVKPAWVVDSIQAGRVLPWDNYRVVDEGVGQKVLAFDKGQVVSQVNRQVKGYREQSDGSWYNTQLRAAQIPSAQGPPNPSSSLSFTTDTDQAASLEHDLAPQDLEHVNAEHIVESEDEFAFDDSLDKHMHPSSPQPLPQATTSEDEFYASDDLDQRTMPLTPQEPPEHSLEKSPENAPASPTEDPPENLPNVAESRGVKRSRSSRSESPRKAAKMTAEEHNAILLADPRIRKSTVVDPNFLEQYYRESRLHHLSTWKADLKAQLQALTVEKSSSQRAAVKRKPGARRYIMHVDFDSFFAAVSLKDLPQYKDKPAVVAHGPGVGSEIASCNYPAREFGVINGMWMKRALELCPDLKVLPYDFPAYEAASRKFYDAILATNGVVQSVSIDEALVDVSDLCISAGGSDGIHRSEGRNFREQAKADELAKSLRDKILELTGCNVSVGIGGNILQAKLALRKAKPAGQYQLKPEEALDFIAGLEVQKLPGVAHNMAGKLGEIGIKIVKDIRDTSKEKLIRALGPKTGEKMYEYARGIDKTEVGDQVVRKSVSAEVNWGVRFENQEQVDEFIQSLCGELSKRLLKEGVKGQQLTVKVMRRSPDAPIDPPKHLGHGKCDTFNKSLQLGVATNNVDTIAKEALATMRGFGFSPGELRGLGIQMTKLEPTKPESDKRPEGSQRRLPFKAGVPARGETAPAVDPITDDIETPKRPRVRDTNPTAIPFSLANSKSPSRRSLNVMGTQFVLPTQIDPKVLAELPEDLRTKLMRQMGPRQGIPADRARETSPSPGPLELKSEAQSRPKYIPGQIDEDFLESLPEDIRAEIRAMYPTSPRKIVGQSLLPQSPRKNRTIPPGKKFLPKKRGGGGLFGRRGNKGDTSTLTQANFVARARVASPDLETNIIDTDGEAGIAEIDQSFIESLPPSLRQEVLDQHRANQLRRTGGLEVSARAKARLRQKQKTQQQQKTAGHSIETYLVPPSGRLKPMFMKKYSELEDLRRVIRDWVVEFSTEEPYDEDVDALTKYLTDVVLEERDMGKAVKVAKWLVWVVDQEIDVGESDPSGIGLAWSNAVLKVKEVVQQAIKTRGLGEVDLGGAHLA